MNVIAHCDGRHDLVQLSEKANVFALDVLPILRQLRQHGRGKMSRTCVPYFSNGALITVIYDARNSWNRVYQDNGDISYPAEGVIRIFKGKFPLLKMSKPRPGDSVLDVGCGDGRHLPFFARLNMKTAAVEITDELVDRLNRRMSALNVPAMIRTGHAADLPFENDTFDYLLTWNSCYYMSVGGTDFQSHVDEMARVLRASGWIVCSLPKKDNFIFHNSIPHEKPGYRVIQDDYFGARNGEVMRCMDSRDDVEASFGARFDTFCHADLDMDWFGLAYRWHVFAARKA